MRPWAITNIVSRAFGCSLVFYTVKLLRSNRMFSLWFIYAFKTLETIEYAKLERHTLKSNPVIYLFIVFFWISPLVRRFVYTQTLEHRNRLPNVYFAKFYMLGFVWVLAQGFPMIHPLTSTWIFKDYLPLHLNSLYFPLPEQFTDVNINCSLSSDILKLFVEGKSSAITIIARAVACVCVCCAPKQSYFEWNKTSFAVHKFNRSEPNLPIYCGGGNNKLTNHKFITGWTAINQNIIWNFVPSHNPFSFVQTKQPNSFWLLSLLYT